MEIIWQIFLVLLMVFLNGYFVASEFALVAIRKTRIDELVKKGNKAAKLVQKALKRLDDYISSTQLGITIASLGLGWIGEPAIAHYLEKNLTFLPKNLSLISSHSLSVIIAFSTITFLHVVLGELAPKTLALQRADSVSLIIIAPLIIFTNIFRPFIWFLNGAGRIVLNLFGLHSPSAHQLVHSEEEIKIILSQSAEGGEIEKQEAEMVRKIFRFADLPVSQLMLPRRRILALHAYLKLKDLLKRVKRSRYSRFPVYDKSIDKITGFVLVKDIYDLILAGKGEGTLKNSRSIRRIIKISENKPADEVFFEMKQRRIHIAAVQDKSSKTIGIVTLEDLLESIVGDIEDEFQKPQISA